NVIEYQENPDQTIASLAARINAGGRLVILVPQGPWLFGTIDRSMGHRRRFRLDDLQKMIAANGLEVERVHQGDKASILAWWIPGKLLRRTRINKPVLKIFDKTVWLWKRIDRLLPWQGLSVVLVARKPVRVARQVGRTHQEPALKEG